MTEHYQQAQTCDEVATGVLDAATIESVSLRLNLISDGIFGAHEVSDDVLEYFAGKLAIAKDTHERSEKYAIIEKVMAQLNSDEREGGLWTACSLVLVGSAVNLNAASAIVTQEGVLRHGVPLGDWRITVERIAAPQPAEAHA